MNHHTIHDPESPFCIKDGRLVHVVSGVTSIINLLIDKISVNNIDDIFW